jgi:hypothetical protein
MAADATLDGVAKGYRRVLIVSAVLGVIGLVVSIVMGRYVAGVTLCAGIALGFINARLTLSAAARFSETEDSSKRPIIFASLRRLAAITVIALLIAYAFRPDGAAALAGLALFHMVLLGMMTTALLGELRRMNA